MSASVWSLLTCILPYSVDHAGMLVIFLRIITGAFQGMYTGVMFFHWCFRNVPNSQFKHVVTLFWPCDSCARTVGCRKASVCYYTLDEKYGDTSWPRSAPTKDQVRSLFLPIVLLKMRYENVKLRTLKITTTTCLGWKSVLSLHLWMTLLKK